MSYKIQYLINELKLVKKSHYVLLSSLILFLVIAVTTSQSITNANIINNIAIAQVTNQTTTTEKINNENENVSSISSISNTSNGKENNISLDKEETTSSNRQITLVTEDVEIDIAPGKRVMVWTYNGTVPGPTIRLAEGENVTIKYINKSPIPHTIHFHGNHDDLNDGVIPQVMPNQTYLYNITGEPAGALMYHCHAPPTSLHIRMGMYGALIVDPKDKSLPPAKEFVMVMGEYSLKNQLGFDADYYIINGYADQYMHNPLQINYGDLMRLYVINLGTTIPVSFHLHSTTFNAYPSGLWDNLPIHAQTASIAPGDASIIEAKWKYPGTFLFHSHGIQEEKGNIGQINVVGEEEGEASSKSVGTNNKNSTTYNEKNRNSNTLTNSIKDSSNISISMNLTATNAAISPVPQSNNSSQPLTKSVSMFDWQYELQKKLQRPQIINYSQDGAIDNKEKENNEIAEIKEIQKQGENLSLFLDKNLVTNITDTNNTDKTLMNNNESQQEKNENDYLISIVPGSSNPSNKIFYEPTKAEVELGTEVTWINNDNYIPHTVTSGNPDTGSSGVFDSGIINGDGSSFKYTFDKKGEYQYYCTLHPWMTAEITVK